MSMYCRFLHGKLLLPTMGTVWSNLILKIGHRHSGYKCCVCDNLNLKWPQPKAFTYEKILQKQTTFHSMSCLIEHILIVQHLDISKDIIGAIHRSYGPNIIWKS